MQNNELGCVVSRLTVSNAKYMDRFVLLMIGATHSVSGIQNMIIDDNCNYVRWIIHWWANNVLYWLKLSLAPCPFIDEGCKEDRRIVMYFKPGEDVVRIIKKYEWSFILPPRNKHIPKEGTTLWTNFVITIYVIHAILYFCVLSTNAASKPKWTSR